MPSSPDSSSDSSTSSPQHPYDGPNVEAENSLPGVVSRSFLNENTLMQSFLSIVYSSAQLFCIQN